MGKPDMNLDCPPIDQGGIERMIKTFAPMQGRNYVVMEVRNNLIEQDRVNLLKKFPSDMFRKIAQVQIGDASTDFKQKTRDLMLARKQEIEDRKHHRSIEDAKKKKKSEYDKKVADFKKAKADREK